MKKKEEGAELYSVVGAGLLHATLASLLVFTATLCGGIHATLIIPRIVK